MNLDDERYKRMKFTDDWLIRVRQFAVTLRGAGHQPGGLLLVGTPNYEPWHFAAHLDDAARLSNQPQLAPTLVRHFVPTGAAPHLAVDLSELHQAARGKTVLVVAPTRPPDDLLNRVDDARHAGAVILTIGRNDHDNLHGIAHDSLMVAEKASDEFDIAQHLIATATTGDGKASRFWRSRISA